MSDEVDQANDNVARDEAIAIRLATTKGPEAEAIGRCLYCDEELPHPKRWCNADCRDGWQTRKNNRRY